MSQSSPETQGASGIWQNANPALFIMQTWATSIEVFIRGNFGARYLGLQAAAVLVLVPLWCMFKRVEADDQLCWWLSLYLVMCFLHRQIARKRQRQGEVWHSYYNGYPALSRFFPWLRCSEVTFKRVVEPLVVVGLGVALIPNDEPFGLYVVIGGFCMAFLANAWAVQDKARLQDLNDSILDQQMLAEHLRESRADRF